MSQYKVGDYKIKTPPPRRESPSLQRGEMKLRFSWAIVSYITMSRATYKEIRMSQLFREKTVLLNGLII